MNWRKSIISLLALNAVLMGWLLARRPGPPPAPAVEAAASAPRSSPPAATAVDTPPASAPALTNDFRWQQLESEDYRTYIRRLRDIGCPEPTIRDIIIADLDRLFAPRLRALYPYRENLKYWEPEEEELANNIDDMAVQQQERAIEREKREVIKELTGADLSGERLQKKGREGYYERRLQFLPEERRWAVQEVLEDYHNRTWAIRQKQLAGEQFAPEDRAWLQQLNQEKEARLDQLLAPEERRTFDLWLSDTAAQVRHDVYGMGATEQEFLVIFEARRQFDKRWNRDWIDLNDEAARQRWEAERVRLDEQLRRSLGEQRYAALQRGQDPDFHTLSAVVNRHRLPTEVAAEVYDYKRAFLDYRDAIGYDGRLSPQEKEQTLFAIQEETRRALLDRLGEVAYTQYVSTADWLNN